MTDLTKLKDSLPVEKQEEFAKALEATDKKVKTLDDTIVSQQLKLAETEKAYEAKLKELQEKATPTAPEPAKENIEVKTDATEHLIIKDKEIKTMKSEVVSLTEKLKEKEEETQKILMNAKLDTEIAKCIPKYKTNPKAVKYLMAEIKENAHYENGNIVFKNQDGTTKRADGKELSVDDILSQKYEEEKKTGNFYFDTSPQASGPGINREGTLKKDRWVPGQIRF